MAESSMQTEVASVAPTQVEEPHYGGYIRFELELEFVQCLANPWYLNHLATQKLLDNPSFISYLDYLQYFKQPQYTRFLTYPGPTLKALQLLQQEKFRKDILSPDVVARMLEEGVRASVGGDLTNGIPAAS